MEGDDPRRVFFVKDLMEPQNQNPPEDSYDPVWWNQAEQEMQQHNTDPSSMSSGFGSPMQAYQESDHFGLHESSSAQSYNNQCYRELLGAIGEINPQDQHVLPEFGRGEQISLGKKADEGRQVTQVQPSPFPSNPNYNSFEDQPPVDHSLAMARAEVQAHVQVHHARARARVPHPYAAGLSVGIPVPSEPRNVPHVQLDQTGVPMLGMIPAKVLLPFEDVEEHRPAFYVNPKQYQGILRRRHCRARLVSQNKLLTARKPYMHESRHLHAKFRARGTGGRFIGNKELLESSNSDSGATGSGGNDNNGDNDDVNFQNQGESSLWRDMSGKLG